MTTLNKHRKMRRSACTYR